MHSLQLLFCEHERKEGRCSGICEVLAEVSTCSRFMHQFLFCSLSGLMGVTLEGAATHIWVRWPLLPLEFLFDDVTPLGDQ